VSASIEPHLIFSGHDHDSAHVSAPLKDVWQKTIDLTTPSSPKWQKYSLTPNVIHEMIVPTCSYRMGVTEMGYGFAIIGIMKSQWLLLLGQGGILP